MSLNNRQCPLQRSGDSSSGPLAAAATKPATPVNTFAKGESGGSQGDGSELPPRSVESVFVFSAARRSQATPLQGAHRARNEARDPKPAPGYRNRSHLISNAGPLPGLERLRGSHRIKECHASPQQMAEITTSGCVTKLWSGADNLDCQMGRFIILVTIIYTCMPHSALQFPQEPRGALWSQLSGCWCGEGIQRRSRSQSPGSLGPGSSSRTATSRLRRL